ncbi:Protein of unknown function [Sinosporangium album]|uniref:DUF732 domain-containing protein n=1 Tax=Sinosporangium album TaxID=504805 RepID=A0A1G8JC13_9ACTN|nr:Protein of unknown function [Sinosporangium album]
MAVIIAAAVAGVLLLGGAIYYLVNTVGTASVVQATPTPLRPLPTAEAPGLDRLPVPGNRSDAENEQIFLMAIQSQQSLKDVEPARVLEMGRTMCTALDSGTPVSEVMLSGTDEFSVVDSGFIFGAAVVALCPQHQEKLNRLGIG